MIKICVVEDEENDFKVVESYINRYQKENNLEIEILHFANGLNFLDDYEKIFDVAFMDIEMPFLDGIEVCKKLREIDSTVPIIFITNMINYAINGYEVNALDFMVKPVQYYNFSSKLNKALSFSSNRLEDNIVIYEKGRQIVISAKSIYYIEKEKNYVVIYTDNKEYRERTTIKNFEKRVESRGFAKCCSGCLVNLNYVTEIGKDIVKMHEIVLPLARRQRKGFLLEFARLCGGMF